MDQFNFDGDVTSLNKIQLDMVTSVLKKQGFSNGNVTIQIVGKAGDNYSANLKRISIEKDGKIFKMIAKLAPTSEQQRMASNSEIMFKNEHVMYTKVLPKFTELEREAGIQEDERLKYAKCYATLMEAPHELILLEDLNESSFCMLDKLVSLADDTIRFVLENFAKLHSMSFILKNQDQETFASYASEFINLWMHFDTVPDTRIFFSLLEADVIEFVENEKSKNAIRGSLVQLSNIMVEKIEQDRGSKYSVIQHGDGWTNNIMFKLENNKTVDCCMIDYQLSCETNPAADILYFIFNCTDYDIRRSYFYDWMDHYYIKLAKRLEKFGLNVDDVYPREQLDADLKRMGKAAFGQAVMASSMLLRETHEAALLQDAMKEMEPGADMQDFMEKMKLSNLDQSSKDRFKKRIEGLITSLFELGYNE